MIVNKQWETKKLLGKGTFGEVYTLKNNTDLVIKIAKGKNANMLFHEYELINGYLRTFPYRAFTPQNFHGEDKILGVRYLVMEKLDITLKDFFKENLDSSFVKDYSTQILQGLKWLHEKDILFIDINSENFMLKNNRVKFIDFGLTTRVLTARHYRNVGTDAYLAVRIHKGEIHSFSTEMESFGYLIMSFMFELPWTIDVSSKEELIEKKENFKLKKFLKRKNLKSIYKIIKNARKNKVNYEKIEKYIKKI